MCRFFFLFVVFFVTLTRSLRPRMPSHKTFRAKRMMAHARKSNRPLPHWIRLRTDNRIRYNAKRTHWRRTKLNMF